MSDDEKQTAEQTRREALERLYRAMRDVLAHSEDRRAAFCQMTDALTHVCRSQADARLMKAVDVVDATGWAVRRDHVRGIDHLHKSACDYLLGAKGTEVGFPFATREQLGELGVNPDDRAAVGQLRAGFFSAYKDKTDAGKALLRNAENQLRGMPVLTGKIAEPLLWATKIALRLAPWAVAPWAAALRESPYLRGATWFPPKKVATKSVKRELVADLSALTKGARYDLDHVVCAALRGFGLTPQAARILVRDARKAIGKEREK